jgi:hypothetical protein
VEKNGHNVYKPVNCLILVVGIGNLVASGGSFSQNILFELNVPEEAC